MSNLTKCRSLQLTVISPFETMQSMRSGIRFLQHHFEVIPGLAIFFLLIAPYFFSLPVWDGQNFYDCIRGAAHEPFEWRYFLCYAHPTILFIGLFAIPEYLFPGSVFMTHLLMFSLGAASIVAFSFLCRRIFPRASRVVRMLSVLLYSVQPIIVSNVIDFNFDSGVTFLFVIFLTLLVYGKEKWAACIGLLMVFTKESGVLLYALGLLAYWIFSVRREHRFFKDAFRSGLRRFWFIVPLFAYFVHTQWQDYLGNSVLHENIPPSTILHSLLSFDLLHERFRLFLIEILVFQFAWFQTLTILCAVALWFWKRDINTSKPFAHSPWLGAVAFLYILGIYLFTRYVPWNNVRYMMPLLPLGILLFTASCIALGRGRRISQMLLSVAVALSGVAMFRSVDPVSLAFLKTFPFGSHKLYALGLYDGCCLFGRDQLIYNLEYRKLFSLQDLAFARIRPTADTVISFPRDAEGSHRALLHPTTFRRTWDQNSLLPMYVSIDDVLGMSRLPPEFYFIDLPNLPADEGKKRVEEKYDIASFEAIERGGYSIGLTKYVLKH